MESNTPKSFSKASIDLLKRISESQLTVVEITDLLTSYPTDRRLISLLLQKPEFPPHEAILIVSKLYPLDLIRIASEPRTNPFIRQRAEGAFIERYRQMQKGEQITALKLMRSDLLKKFVSTHDAQLLTAILSNPRCTEPVIIEMLRQQRVCPEVYQAIMQSKWLHNIAVAEVLALDPCAPVRIHLAIIPILPLAALKRWYKQIRIHSNVKKTIGARLGFR